MTDLLSFHFTAFFFFFLVPFLLICGLCVINLFFLLTSLYATVTACLRLLVWKRLDFTELCVGKNLRKHVDVLPTSKQTWRTQEAKKLIMHLYY